MSAINLPLGSYGIEKYRDVNVLDDNILGAVGEAQAFALDDTTASYANDTLIASDIDGVPSSIRISASHPSVAAGVHDLVLAIRLAGVSAALSRGRTLVAGEVPSLVNHDDTRGRVGEPCHQPLISWF
jgi:hypothetical protein